MSNNNESHNYYDLLKHSENTYNNRNNYFIVFHSISFAVVSSTLTSEKFSQTSDLTFLISILSTVFALLWLMSNIKAFLRIGKIKEKFKEAWFESIGGSWKCFSVNFVTGIVFPFIICLFWLWMLVYKL